MSKGKPITVNGIEYLTFLAACRAHGLSDQRVRHRLKKGYSIDQAFSTESFAREISIVVDGIKYESVNEAARAYGLKPITAHARLRKGWPAEKVFSADQQNKMPVVVAGVKYPSIAAAADHHRVDSFTAYARIQRGWTLEQAFEVEPLPETANPGSRGISIEVKGKTFKTISEACRHYGLSANKVAVRLRKLNWTIEQAFEIDTSRLRSGTPGAVYVITNRKTGKQYVGITLRSIDERLKAHIHFAEKGRGGEGSLAEAIRTHGKDAFSVRMLAKANSFEEMMMLEAQYIESLGTRAPGGYNKTPGGEIGGNLQDPVIVNGKRYDSVGHAARSLGLKVELVYSRLHGGWTLEQALEIEKAPVHPSKKSVVIDGKQFTSYKEAADYFGVHKVTFANRLARGWTLEQAVELEPPPVKPLTTAVETTVGGITYESIKAAADAHSLKVETVKWRLGNGWSVEQAFGLEQRKR